MKVSTAMQESASGGALSLYKDCSVTVVWCQFEHNVAVYEGAFAANLSIHPVNFAEEKERNCHENGSHIENNAGRVSGGGIFLHDCPVSVQIQYWKLNTLSCELSPS